MWTITCPVTVQVTKKGKPYILNLNVYRNTHFLTLNKAKEKFREIVTPLLAGVPKMQRVMLTFTHFPGSNRLCDTSNVCSVIDKFFCDALVTAGLLEDDNYTVLPDVLYRHGGVDKGNGRVEVLIEPMGEIILPTVKGTRTMQLVLSNAEIELAIYNHVNSMFTLNEGSSISVAIEGDIVVELLADGEAPSTPQPEKKTRAPRGSKQAAKAADPVPEPKVKEEPEPQVIEKHEVTQQGAITQGRQDVGLGGDADDQEEDPEVEAEEEQAEEQAPPVNKATSLFAGLNRVKNG